MIDDRFALYLPRNLSYCNVCVEASAQHIQKKISLIKKTMESIKKPLLDTSNSSPPVNNKVSTLPFSTTLKSNNMILSLSSDEDYATEDEVFTIKNPGESDSEASGSNGDDNTKPIPFNENIMGNPGLDEITNPSLLVPSASRNSIESMFSDNEFEDVRPEMRRATSLKTTKTPPGTPRRKKMVRFADALGLDLEMVRHIMNSDLPPNICNTFSDTSLDSAPVDDMVCKYLSCNFSQPGLAINFFDRLRVEKVILENTIISDLTVTGIIRVLNIAFNKRIFVRFTVNKWETTHEVPATYVHGSHDGFSDKFSFTIFAPIGLEVDQQLELAVCYQTAGQEFWDNNHGSNYSFNCCIRTVAAASINRGWYHFI